MKNKALFIILTLILVVFCTLSLFGCNEGEVPAETIVVTKLPKLEYYRGDFFDLSSSEVTVYYENGRTKVVPLTLDMLSTYDAQNIGDQTLTIKYENTTAYIKVTVKEAPIYNIAVVDGSYKKEYVQFQTLSLNNLKLRVTYTNNFSEVVDITQDMITNFDTNDTGLKELIVSYKGQTTKFSINVVKKSIQTVSIIPPDKLKYVVGDFLDFTNGQVEIHYNNNTKETKTIEEISTDASFSVKIGNRVSTEFTESGRKIVTVSYGGIDCEFSVDVDKLKAKSIKLINHPLSPVINSAFVDITESSIVIKFNDERADINIINNEANRKDYWRRYGIVDLSGGSVEITFNNGVQQILSMDSQDLTIDWHEFSISRAGANTITFGYMDVALSYDITVIEAKEQELIIIVPETDIYQDSQDIDITQWQYRIKLTNGMYRAFDDLGSTVAYLNESMIKDNTSPNFSTSIAGERQFVFEFVSADRSITLEKTVAINVVAKQIVEIVNFQRPTREIYNQHDTIGVDGGRFKVRYNDNTVSDWIDIAIDMIIFEDSITEITAEINNDILVLGRYVDSKYNSFVQFSYSISVIKKANAMSIETYPSKTNYILGDTFDSSGLVVKVNFGDTSEILANFSDIAWQFVGTEFNQTGNFVVQLYYGDISDNIVVSITVIVKNEIVNIAISGLSIVNDMPTFGSVYEGLAINVIGSAKLIVTRENNYQEIVDITASMLNYDKNDNTLGQRHIIVRYEGHTAQAVVTVLQRELTSFNISKLPTKLEYVYTDNIAIDLAGLVLKFAFNNNTVADVHGNTILDIHSQTPQATVYNLAINHNNYFLQISNLDTDLNGNAYLEQTIVITVLTLDSTVLFSHSFDIICFERLINKISFEIDQTIVIKEGFDFVFPANAKIKIYYSGESSSVDYFINTIDPSQYTVSNFDKNKAGSQTLTLEYLFKKCTFNVKVRAKLLSDITVTPSAITVIEGMDINASDVDIKLHFVDADGVEFAVPRVISAGISTIDCSYNKNNAVIFDKQDENGLSYYEAVFTMSYTYGYFDYGTNTNQTITKSTNITIRIYRKSMTEIRMGGIPQTEYIENSTNTLNLDGGSIVVHYNNGTSETIALTNANIVIDDRAFNTAERHNGSEETQVIKIQYSKNNITKQTEYTVVVKDRKYFTINYTDSPTNNTYLYEYGTGEAARPEFDIYGFLTFGGNQTIFATHLNIQEITGMELYYIDSDGQVSYDWPKNVGIYTMAISYVGDGINNPYLDTSRKIQVLPKSIVIKATNASLTYGENYLSVHDVFEWVVQGYHKNGNIITYTDNPLVYTEQKDIVANVDFKITTTGHVDVNFYRQGGITVVSSTVGSYLLIPIMVEQLSNNYKIEQLIVGELSIVQKEIKIVAQNATKVYGAADPKFEFIVYDELDNLIGGNVGGAGIIALGGGFEDAITNYNLSRATNDTNNVLDTHEIFAGAASQIANYKIISYTSAYLTITKKSITIGGDAVQKIYGSDTPTIVFKLKNGSTMAYNDIFNDVFAPHIYKSGSKYSISIYKESDLDNQISVDNDLPIDSNIGLYKVLLNILAEDIPNYQLSIDYVDLFIVPTNVDIELNCILKLFDSEDLDLIADGFDIGWYKYSVDSSLINYNFPSAYTLDATELSLEFIKSAGKNVGKYELKISNYAHENNQNFVLNLIGNYQMLYADMLEEVEEFSTVEIAQVPQEEWDKCYLIIYPNLLDIAVDESEQVYGHKTSIWLDTEYSVDSNTISDSTTVSALNNALSFSFVNRDLSRANLGYYTADSYDGQYTYSYFNSIISRNYCIFDESTAYAAAEIFNYVFNGVVGSYVYTYDFEYVITPFELDIECTNFNTNYIGIEITISYSNYTLCHESDVLGIYNDIKVVYNDTTSLVAASKVQEAGTYTIKLLGVSNYNYTLSQDTLDRTKSLVVSPTLLKVWVDETKLTREYVARELQPLDNNWIINKGANDEEGYFRTQSHKIVNDVLGAAPKELSIYPVDANGNYPRNAGEYSLYVRQNSEYKNLSVMFVKLNESWNSGDSLATKYIEYEYKFVITKKLISLYQWEYCNEKTFDNLAPVVNNISRLILNGSISSDNVLATDLLFSFTRDMSKIPTAMQGMIAENDMTSAGYFNVEVSIKNTNPNYNNYYFEINSSEDYYIINRVTVAITLNSSNSSLTKQYDKTAPSAQFSDLNKGQTVVFDDVYFDIVVMSYKSGASWINWQGNNTFNVGNYAYNLRPKFKNGNDYIYYEDELNQPLYDPTNSQYKLLSWNYCYRVNEQIGFDTNNCDGVYVITPKDISIAIGTAKNEIYTFDGAVSAEHFVYSKTYSTQTITLQSALNEINAIFSILDNNGAVMDAVYYNDFNKINLTGTGGSVKDAGDYFNISYEDLQIANPNYNITNKPILYAVKQLKVDLTLGFENTQNSNLSLMTYGDKVFENGQIHFVLNFVDIAAFNSATGYSYTTINDFVSSNSAHFDNDKLIIALAIYKLMDGSVAAYTSSVGSTVSGSPYTMLNAKSYVPTVERLTVKNYDINIIAIPFVVAPKEIKINGLTRNYFDKNISADYYIEGGSINGVAENTILTSWNFLDNTAVNADASNFNTNASYYARILKINMVTNNTNYILNITECTGLSGTDSNYYYIPLTVKKINLIVGFTNYSGGSISVQYGHLLSGSEYKLNYTNLPILSEISQEYNYAIEKNKQDAVLQKIYDEFINIPAILERIRTTSVGSYTLSLNNYLYGVDTTLSNFEITFASDVAYSITKIRINIEIINNAGSTYNPNGYFSILYDEQNALFYSTSSIDRLSYSFAINNPNAIIRPDSVVLSNLVEYMTYILDLKIENGVVVFNYMPTIFTSFNDFVVDYINTNIRYQLTQNGDTYITAGMGKIKLTDNWYNSQNYSLVCEQKDIIIYPKITSLGDGEEGIKYSAISLLGQATNYETAIQSLSMYLQVYFNGLPDTTALQWVDIKMPQSSNYYTDANYVRNWTVNIVAGQEIVVGKDIILSLTMTETFYYNIIGATSVQNTLTSEEFLVRLYAPTQEHVVDNTTSQIVRESDSTVFDYNQNIVGNHTHYFSKTKQTTTAFEGKFDILNLKVKLSPLANFAEYYTDFILFENNNNVLTLRIQGGDNNYYQLEMKDKVNNEIYYSEVLSSLDDVDLFDGMTHTLKIYIDKLGYAKNAQKFAIPNGEQIVADRYYKVMFVIDDAFSCNLEYNGGIVTQTTTIDISTGLVQTDTVCTKYIDFDANGKVGFVLSNTTININNISAETMGVKLSANGYITDFMLSPTAFSNNYSYYVTNDGNIDASTILQTISFNSNYGYVKDMYIEAVIKDDITNDIVVGILENGTYSLTIKSYYQNSLVETRTIRLIVSQTTFRKTSIGTDDIPKYSAPIVYENADGGNYYTSNLGSFVYSKLVFDYKNMNDSSIALATILLKTNENSNTNIITYDENYPNYMGMAIYIEYNPITQAYTTKLLLRIKESYVAIDLPDGIQWAGSRNVLEVRYSQDSQAILITLHRAGTQLFMYTLRNGLIPGLTGDDINKVTVETKSHIAFNLYNTSLKMYTMELDNKVNVNLEIKDNIISTDTLLTDGEGAPISTHSTTTFFRFRANAEFKFIFASTLGVVPELTPYPMPTDNGSGLRGAMLAFNGTRVAFHVFKYNVLFDYQEVVRRNILDNNWHTVIIRTTKTVVVGTNGENYLIEIILDGVLYSVSCPVWNDLRMLTADGGTGSDREVQESIKFLHEYRYLALMPSSTVEVSDLILY